MAPNAALAQKSVRAQRDGRPRRLTALGSEPVAGCAGAPARGPPPLHADLGIGPGAEAALAPSPERLARVSAWSA